MRKLALILILILIATSLGCGIPTAFAATDNYSNVLDDLGKDETFNVDNFPAKDKLSNNDKVMDVIQIAESNTGELFLYVYQPIADKFTATEARISTSIGENLAPADYKLTLLSRNGTLAKYRVDDLQVKVDAVRYYLIIQIARPWDKAVDKGTGNDNTAKTVPYDVSKLFTACTDKDGIVTYTEQHAETISITAKYCGFVRNFVGWQGTATADVDSHFIAFDTNRPMNRLMQATVTYDCYSYVNTTNRITGKTTERYRSEVSTNKAELKADEHHTIPALGWVGQEYTWKEIERANEFLTRQEVSADMRKNVADKQWVLRFVATAYAKVDMLEVYEETGTRVSNATILELTFETDGIVYNLGVVDNKQTGSDEPINDPLKWWQAFLENARQRFENAGKWLSKNWWVIVVAVVGILLIVSLAVKVLREGLWIVIKAIGKGIWFVIKYLFIGLYYILASPVYLIAWIVRKARGE